MIIHLISRFLDQAHFIRTDRPHPSLSNAEKSGLYHLRLSSYSEMVNSRFFQMGNSFQYSQVLSNVKDNLSLLCSIISACCVAQPFPRSKFSCSLQDVSSRHVKSCPRKKRKHQYFILECDPLFNESSFRSKREVIHIKHRTDILIAPILYVNKSSFYLAG